MSVSRRRAMRLDRRTFLKGGLSAMALAACGDDSGFGPITYEPETAPLQFSGYAGLADTPFFRLRNGRLINVVENMPPAIDFHGHLGFAVSIPRDLTRDDLPVRYLIECEEEGAGEGAECEFDMEVYLNRIADEETLESLEGDLVAEALTGRGKLPTHSVPNLVQELDEMQFDRAVLLPISMGLLPGDPMADNMTEQWANAISETGQQDRFVQFCSVHPKGYPDSWRDRLQGYIDMGYTGIKFHPTIQSLAPNSDEAMELFQMCSDNNLRVFFHSGRAGIEPERLQPFALMENYVAPLEEFPDVQFIFGHSGAREDWRPALDIAKEYDNVWMELAGPSLQTLKALLEEFDNERIVFGSDWPFYPIAASLVKVFHATWGDDSVRDLILAHNARRLLGLDS